MTRACAALLALVCAQGVGGCLAKNYPTRQRFVLDAAPAQASPARPLGVVRVDRIQVSPVFEKSGFIYRTGESRYAEDFYNQFFVPPGTLVGRVTCEWIRNSGLFARVLAPEEPDGADWILEGRVLDLYGDVRDAAAPRAMLTIEYTLLLAKKPQPSVRFRRRYQADEPVAESTPQALVDAWNRGLATILQELETDLRAERARAE